MCKYYKENFKLLQREVKKDQVNGDVNYVN